MYKWWAHLSGANAMTSSAVGHREVVEFGGNWNYLRGDIWLKRFIRDLFEKWLRILISSGFWKANPDEVFVSTC